jgi:hypothetical protein
MNHAFKSIWQALKISGIAELTFIYNAERLTTSAFPLVRLTTIPSPSRLFKLFPSFYFLALSGVISKHTGSFPGMMAITHKGFYWVRSRGNLYTEPL